MDLIVNSENIKNFITFKRKISKSGSNRYISIPFDFIDNEYLTHGKKYRVILIPEENNKNNLEKN